MTTEIAQKSQVSQKERKESDALLINIMRTGTPREREQAYAELYQEYIEFLNYFFSKSVSDQSTAEDLALESIGKAFTKLDQYDDKYAFSTWMQTIATRTLIDFKRKQEIEVSSFEDLGSTDEEGKTYGFEAESDELQPDDVLSRKNSHSDLHSKIKLLKPRYRKLIEMRFLQELSYNEIADALSASVGTIKAQLFRAKEALALQYEEQ